MAKSLESMNEIIRNTKHPFRQLADRPQKAEKHRYERRKVKQVLQLGDWSSGEQLAAT